VIVGHRRTVPVARNLRLRVLSSWEIERAGRQALVLPADLSDLDKKRPSTSMSRSAMEDSTSLHTIGEADDGGLDQPNLALAAGPLARSAESAR
jgi:hypothetical protein